MDGVKKWIGRLLSEETDSVAFIVHGRTIMAVLSELSEDVHEFYHWQVENGGGYVAEVTAESIEEIILLCSLLYYNGHRNSREEIWTKFTADMGEVGIFGG